MRQIRDCMRCNRYLIEILMAFFPLWMMAKPYTVVIDAGHGGKDAGAVGYYMKLQEKDLNLEISLRLAAKIRSTYPDINVVLTRSSDVFLPLQRRADIVNQNKANLFICIHTNAAENRNAHGAETFILGTERMEDNLDVAMRENAVMKLESDYQTAYQGFDPNSVESYIMFDLMQNQYVDQSLQFASFVQTHLVNDLKRDDRGVRQAAFWVLLKSACPSVLVEMGFVSNKEEEKYMASDQGKREITDAIFQAFCKYYTSQSVAVQPVTPQSSVVPAEESVEKESASVPVNKNNQQKETQPAAEQTVVYGVQIFASRHVLAESDGQFKGLTGCRYILQNDWYKYVYGNCSTAEEARQLKISIRDKFPDCFVVEIKDNNLSICK